MRSEYLLITVFLCAAIFPLLAVWGRVAIPRRVSVLGVLAVWIGFPLTVVVTSFANRDPLADAEQATHRPIAVESDGYIGSDSCRSCHPHEHATWHASFHRTMTQVAARESIIPAVDDIRFDSGGLKSHLEWKGDELWAYIDMPRSARNSIETFKAPIVMTTGSHHMQVFWYSLRANTRLVGMFPYIFLNDEQKWIPRGAAFLQPTFGLGDEVGRWNQACIACHTTFGRTRPAEKMDSASGQLVLDPFDPDSLTAEFGISCEACHGPGEKHVAANRSPVDRFQKHLSGEGDSQIVNPGELPHKLKSQVCGQCHAVQRITAIETWWKYGFTYRPGDDLEKSHLRFVVRVGEPIDKQLQSVLAEDPAFVADHFWPDGMVRISGREYNGLLESPCYQRGTLSCLTCHEMHQAIDDDRDVGLWANDQLQQGMTDNQACTQCHGKLRDEETLTQHTHHNAQSAGSNCYNCHMSYTTYGLLKAIRSHQIDSPDIAVSLKTGRPNACNQCHLDKTMAWAAQHLSDWYGLNSVELSQDEQSIAASILWLLRGDAGQRVLMAWSYGWNEARQVSGTEWMAPYLAQLLEDPYAAVRLVAQRSLRTLDGYQGFDYNVIGSTSHLKEAHQQVLEIWMDSPPRSSTATLIGPSGALIHEDFLRLLRERDDRPITLVE